MKKFLSVMACLVMVLVGGVALAACGPKTNDFITVSEEGGYFDAAPEVKYMNTDTFKLEYKGNNHYVATGDAAVMDATQAATWGTVEGSKYVVIDVKLAEGEMAYIGWKSAEDADVAFTEDDIDGTTNKKSEGDEGATVKNYILALSDGDVERHPELTTWRFQIEVGDEKVAYTIDFSAFYSQE